MVTSAGRKRPSMLAIGRGASCSALTAPTLDGHDDIAGVDAVEVVKPAAASNGTPFASAPSVFEAADVQDPGLSATEAPATAPSRLPQACSHPGLTPYPDPWAAQLHEALWQLGTAMDKVTGAPPKPIDATPLPPRS